jgi:hypothetical protein
MSKPISRRVVLTSIAQISFAGALAAAVTDTAIAAEKACADPTAMDSGQRSLRASLNYTERSADVAKTCSGCAFFQPSADACGTCTIFSGPANPKGHCDSWSSKS